MNNNYKCKINAICQGSSFGVQEPRLTGNSKYTKSAKHFKFDAKDLGIVLDDNKGKNNSNSETAKVSESGRNSNSLKTTTSFEIITDPEIGFGFLNKVDVSNKTPDFVRKSVEYKDHKDQVLKVLDPKAVDGAGKLTYYNMMKAYTFKFYTVVYRVSLIDGEGKVVKTTLSKKHYRLNRLKQSEFEDAVNSIVNKLKRNKDKNDNSDPHLNEIIDFGTRNVEPTDDVD
jgi:hypothetical protein